MKEYYKYICLFVLMIFSFYYTSVVKELSESNNEVISLIDEYSLNNDKKCIEGYITKDGIVLSYNGLLVDKQSSYSNMKTTGFREDLIEYKNDECILNKDNNLDKYIISGNKYVKNISIVIDVIDRKYYEKIKELLDDINIPSNYLVNYNDIDIASKNILIKTNSDNISKIKKRIKHFYCVKYNNYDVINYCKKNHINSINMINYIDHDLLLNTKKVLSNGLILFIRENESNYVELYPTIKYIESRGYNIVSIDELLS